MILTAAVVAASLVTASAADQQDHGSTVTLVYDHPIPNVPGKSLKGVLVVVAGIADGAEPGGLGPPCPGRCYRPFLGVRRKGNRRLK